MKDQNNIKVDDQIHIIISKEIERLFKLSMKAGLDTDDLKKLDTLAKIYRHYNNGDDKKPSPLDSMSESDKIKNLLGAVSNVKE